MMHRRDMLKVTAASFAVVSTAKLIPALGQTPPAAPVPNPYGRRGLGAAFSGWGQRIRANNAAKIDWIDYCHSIGLGGVEAQTAPTDPAAQADVRRRIERYDMRLMYEFRPPRTDADIPAFEESVKSAQACGAYALHGGLTPRRYEQNNSLLDFQTNFAAVKASVARALPILERYKMPASIENHKGWKAWEQAAWFKQVSSEYVRVHLDFGNNIALCEDPMETLDILLPYIFACHIKDMAVKPYEEGFLLSEVPLGQGFLDLKGMVAKLRAKDPNMGFDMETITRDPLKIPVFTDKYWATFDDTVSPFPGRDLRKMWAIVEENPPKQPLPYNTGLSPADQLAQEDRANQIGIDYARRNLMM
jgi:sugar phosphate isomerase/epimerase